LRRTATTSLVRASERSYWAYILASWIGGMLYIGVTNDLVRWVGRDAPESGLVVLSLSSSDFDP